MCSRSASKASIRIACSTGSIRKCAGSSRRTCVILCSLLMLSAATLVLVQFDKFYAKLPGFHQFFQRATGSGCGSVLCVTKVMHEFGHGLSCKHFKGECHELGFMLLVLTPCLYCNVSDSWMLPNKWQRAAIGAGGHVCRAGARFDRHLRLVVQRAGPDESTRAEHDVRLLGEHADLQRQPAAALRRLLHPRRRHRNSQTSAKKLSTILTPQARRLVPGPRRAGRPVSAAAESGFLRDL